MWRPLLRIECSLIAELAVEGAYLKKDGDFIPLDVLIDEGADIKYGVSIKGMQLR